MRCRGTFQLSESENINISMLKPLDVLLLRVEISRVSNETVLIAEDSILTKLPFKSFMEKSLDFYPNPRGI